VFDYALPTDIYDNETNKSILQVRIGRATDPLTPLDEREFDEQMRDVARSTVRVTAVVGATTLDIVNSYDFTATGTINAYTTNTADSITYAGITRSATVGVLSTIAASGASAITAAHAVGINVWQGEREGEPRYFNVRSGRIRIYPLPDATWINKNVVLDYNEEATNVDSESDVIDAPRYDMVQEWLLFKGHAYWRNNGVDDINNASFKMFQDILKSALRTEISSQKYKMRPAINEISYRSSRREKFENS
jgi:hypothetical protein